LLGDETRGIWATVQFHAWLAVLISLRSFLLPALALLLIALMPLVSFGPLTWHDQQRIGQVLLAGLCVLALIQQIGWCREVRWQRLALSISLLVLLLGLTSALLATSPTHAVSEIAVLVISVGIAACVAVTVARIGDLAHLALTYYVRFVLLAIVMQFYGLYVAALLQPDLYFSPLNLFGGFSNIRHQGQFLTLALPLIAWGVVDDRQSGRLLRYFDTFVIVSVSGFVFFTGTRGTIGAWVVCGFLFLILGGRARQLALHLLPRMLVGFVLSWIMLKLLASIIDYDHVLRFASASVFGLSGREMLWQAALDSIVLHPWLGLGPMHFATLQHSYGAHPHQALLQIGSEWGLLVLGLVLFMVCRWLAGAFRFASVVRDDANGMSMLRWAILFALLSSLTQSMVDGVLVMPYPQIWLALVVGWGMAVFPRQREGTIAIPSWVLIGFLVLATTWLLFVVLGAYPSLIDAPEYCSAGPRFWCNGIIGFP